MKLVFGLGNPGSKYKETRHNVGYKAVKALANTYQINNFTYELNASIAQGRVFDEKIYLIKPCSYMNNSGKVVKNIINYYQGKLQDLIIIYDDLDLPVGKIRIKTKGSSGGHNGIKSIINNLGTSEFPRIKIGIDHPLKQDKIIDYVLGYFNEEDEQLIDSALKEVIGAFEVICKKGYNQAMNKYN